MNTSKEELEEVLSKAKMDVMWQGSAFLSTVTFSLKHEWDTSIPSACTNGKVSKYNPNFMMQLTSKMRSFVVAHESWHIALNHLQRLGDKDFKIFNMAADYVINQLLVDSGFVMPKMDGEKIGYQDNKFRGKSTEEVYDILIKDPANKDKSSPMDGDIEPSEDQSEEEQNALQGHIKEILVKAKMRSEMADDPPGSIPGEIQRLIDNLVNPKLPWEKIVARFLSDTIKDDYSWSKPNKRFFPDYILPSLHSENLGHIVLAFDTSGSLTKKVLTAYISEARSLHNRFKPSKMTILACDYKVNNVYTIKPQDKIENLVLKGNGGTRFKPVFEHIKEMKDKPKVLIYFTDLYAKPIQKEPGYPVIWICNSDHEPALIGKTIYTK